MFQKTLEILSAFSLCLMAVDQDVISQLLLQHHDCLPYAMLFVMMYMNSNPLKLLAQN